MAHFAASLTRNVNLAQLLCDLLDVETEAPPKGDQVRALAVALLRAQEDALSLHEAYAPFSEGVI